MKYQIVEKVFIKQFDLDFKKLKRWPIGH